MDIGAATGGFTQVLLNHGARRVYAIDTTRGKIAFALRHDPRVVVYEKTDIRRVCKESLTRCELLLNESMDIIVIDVSLIPLEYILEHIHDTMLSKPDGRIIALFKPQYQTRDSQHLRHGIIRSDTIRKELLAQFEQWATQHHWRVNAMMSSPIRGGKGNIEYLYLITHSH